MTYLKSPLALYAALRAASVPHALAESAAYALSEDILTLAEELKQHMLPTTDGSRIPRQGATDR